MGLEDDWTDLQDAAEDVLAASWDTIDDLIRRLISPLDGRQELGFALAAKLPQVDFSTWYSERQATMGSMVGSGRINWPDTRPERVAYQLELLRAIAKGDESVTGYARLFAFAHDYPESTYKFQEEVITPFIRDLTRLCGENLRNIAGQEGRSEAGHLSAEEHFVDPDRLAALAASLSPAYDLTRLITLCQELNVCWAGGAYYAVAMLTRALIDHIPPIFGKTSFGEVVDNVSFPRSTKEALRHLDESARNTADQHLHLIITSHEMPPSRTQVDCRGYLDTLITEVVKRCGHG